MNPFTFLRPNSNPRPCSVPPSSSPVVSRSVVSPQFLHTSHQKRELLECQVVPPTLNGFTFQFTVVFNSVVVFLHPTSDDTETPVTSTPSPTVPYSSLPSPPFPPEGLPTTSSSRHSVPSFFRVPDSTIQEEWDPFPPKSWYLGDLLFPELPRPGSYLLFVLDTGDFQKTRRRSWSPPRPRTHITGTLRETPGVGNLPSVSLGERGTTSSGGCSTGQGDGRRRPS